jgi:hypothetical protein
MDTLAMIVMKMMEKMDFMEATQRRFISHVVQNDSDDEVES